MQERILRDVRVLIVENIPDQLEGLKNDLELIDKRRRRAWGIHSFKSDLASSVEEAENHLAAAASPYDILILDLGLPKRKGDLDDPPKHGQEFLESIRKEAVKEVIIVSVFREYENVIEAVRKGAVDFIAKPFNTALLQARVMESWKRVLEKGSAHLLQERIKELVHYNERGLAYRYTSCFGSFANDVLHKTNQLEEHLHNRYGLNRKRDSQDYLLQSLLGVEASVNAAKQKWRKLQVPSLPQEEAPGVKTIEPMFHELERGLLPCLIVKKVKLRMLASDETKVLSFQDDVRAIVKEIICGALAELSDYGSPHDGANQDKSNKPSSFLIGIEVSSQNEQARVTFNDNLPPISDDDAEQINTGSFTASEHRFSRAWGLAVMQHIAILGGGRLMVEPQEHGNLITFLIPLDSHA
jgi:DNA-binding response OmpR family regulator